MKTYELIQDGIGGEALKVTFENKSYGFIPTDPANSDYAEYLRYTAWVEAGNNPQDFWAQNNEPELLQPSEPKEEGI